MSFEITEEIKQYFSFEIAMGGTRM